MEYGYGEDIQPLSSWKRSRMEDDADVALGNTRIFVVETVAYSESLP